MNRRTFIAALSSVPFVASHITTASAARRLNAIGVQLYTVRSVMEKDFEGTIARVAAIGYKEVEFAGYYNRTPEQIRSILGANGLTSPATHIGLESADDRWQQILDRCAAIGHRYVVVPGIDRAKLKTLDDWKRVAASFNRAGEMSRKAGIQFTYHNHQFEFEPVEGTTPYDILLSECDADLVKLEMDIAGLAWPGRIRCPHFERYPGRFPLLHVKDVLAKHQKKGEESDARKKNKGAENGDAILADVGSGIINWRQILASAEKAGAVHFFVEHDSPADPLKSITASYKYLQALTL